jgi:hypothetical protein
MRNTSEGTASNRVSVSQKKSTVQKLFDHTTYYIGNSDDIKMHNMVS